MAVGRGREEWDHTAMLMAFVGNRLGGDGKLDPAKLNPYRSTRPKRTPEQEERDNKYGWRLLEAGLKNLAGG